MPAQQPTIALRRSSTAAPPAGYNATTFQNDIALLLLDKAVSRTPAVLPPATRECAVVVVVVVVAVMVVVLLLLLLLHAAAAVTCCPAPAAAVAEVPLLPPVPACPLHVSTHPSSPHPINPRQAKHALPRRHLCDHGGLG